MIDATSAAASAGGRAFVQHPVRGWEPGRIAAIHANKFSVACDGEKTEPFDVGPKSVFVPHAEKSFREMPSDLLRLSELHPATLLNCLRLRHQRDDVYTSMGDLLVALNPFKYTIPYYQASMMSRYLAHLGKTRIPTMEEISDSLGGDDWSSSSPTAAASPHHMGSRFPSAASASEGGAAPSPSSATPVLRPHPWCVAHRVYHELMASHRNQTVLVSGESGSGKTETCKIVLSYLCALSQQQRQAQRPSSSTSSSLTGGGDASSFGSSAIVTKVQSASPILEAFGNAKTARNDNSSRFGRLMEIQFDTNGTIMGMKTTPYLLERLRVVSAAKDERVFHSFYMLVAGAPPDLRRTLSLRSVREHALLGVGGCTTVRNVDDGAGFVAVQEAFKSVGFTAEEVTAVWRVVAAVIHLVDIQFVSAGTTSSGMSANSAKAAFAAAAASNGGSSGAASMDGNAAIDAASELKCNFIATELLRINYQQFHKSLTSTMVQIRNETTTMQLSRKKAMDQRDTLCKHLYARLFHWIIHRINQLTHSEGGGGVAGGEGGAVLDPLSTTTSASTREEAFGGSGHSSGIMRGFISLLDIFGFEDMAENSLEQMCINMANEALQRHYAKHVFEKDVDDLINEGVNCEGVRFRDNQPCLDLLMSNKGSIVSILDDASALDAERSGGVNPNKIFLDNITKKFKPDFQTNSAKGTSKSVIDRNDREFRTAGDFFNRGRLDDDSFVIKHYAGDVRYKIDNFVEKNVDFLKDGVIALLGTTSDPVLMEMLFPESASSSGSGGGRSFAGSLMMGGGAASAEMTAPPMSPSSPRAANGRKMSIAAQFRQSLKDLTTFIDDTTPTWIRCIRPHPKKLPGAFDGRSVSEQLIASGVLETVAQRQRSYPVRMDLAEFVHSFSVVAPSLAQHRHARNSGPASPSNRLALLERASAIMSVALTLTKKTPLSVLQHDGSGGGLVKANEVDGQVGKNKVFMQSNLYAALQSARMSKLHERCAVISRYLRARASRQQASNVRHLRAARNVQRLFRLSRRLRRCIRKFYEELWRRIEERLATERKLVIQAETSARSDVAGHDATFRTQELASFRTGLLPLIGQVMLNVQRVEAARRLLVIDAFTAERSDMGQQVQVGKRDAEDRFRRRLLWERECAVARERAVMQAHVEEGRKLRELECDERQALATRWVPVRDHIRGLLQRKALLERHRDTLVATLEQEKQLELTNLRRRQEERVRQQEDLWRVHVGPRVMANDVNHFAELFADSPIRPVAPSSSNAAKYHYRDHPPAGNSPGARDIEIFGGVDPFVVDGGPELWRRAQLGNRSDSQDIGSVPTARAEAKALLQHFYAQANPSSIVCSSPVPPRAAQAADPSIASDLQNDDHASRRGSPPAPPRQLGQIRSLKDYATFWQTKFDEDQRRQAATPQKGPPAAAVGPGRVVIKTI